MFAPRRLRIETETNNTMIASLMMYHRPELAAANNRYWALIRAELAAAGIHSPKRLSQTTPEFTVWNDPTLVFSQTCGMPYRLWLHDRVALVGTPDFGLDGCPPGYYRSAMVVRQDDERTDWAQFGDSVFAYNQTYSQSGYASAYFHLAPHGHWPTRRLHCGQHRESARSVAEGRADVAALDAVTWQLMKTYEPFATGLRVLEWTKPSPGLPYITAAGSDADAVFGAVQQAVDELAAGDRATLGVVGIVQIPPAQYLAVPNPPEDYEFSPKETSR